MIVTYRRVGGMQPPPDRELLTIDDDGSFTLWRSVGWATYPPTPVGRFSGRLDGQGHMTLDAGGKLSFGIQMRRNAGTLSQR